MTFVSSSNNYLDTIDNVSDISDAHVVKTCILNDFLGTGSTNASFQCLDYMATKCSQNWDNQCNLYLKNLKSIKDVKQFLGKNIDKKYCRLDDKSKCYEKCESFDPTGNSVKVCKYEGLSKCDLKCDKKKFSDISQDDAAINLCLKYNFSLDHLTQLCEEANKSNQTISHPGLKTYCQLTSLNTSNNLNNLNYETTTYSIDTNKLNKNCNFILCNVNTIGILFILLLSLFYIIYTNTRIK